MTQYNVALKEGVDYDGFWNDMESDTDGGKLYIPNRVVQYTNERPASLNAFTSSLKAATIFSGSIQIGANLVNYANDAAAAAGGVPVGGLYHTTGTVKVRLT